METADGRIILFIVIGIALFILGRRVQRMLDLWRSWRGTVAAVPKERAAAFAGVRTVFKVGAVCAVVFYAVTNINHFM